MNINVYIEDQLANQLSQYAEKFHKKRNSIVREAIRDWLTKHTQSQWPRSIIEFEGIQDFPDIKELRKDIIESKKSLF